MMKTHEAFQLILNEYERARELYPHWPKDLIHQTAIMAEESGEAVKAALDHVYHGGDIEDVRTELIHTAATCVRCLVNMKG